MLEVMRGSMVVMKDVRKNVRYALEDVIVFDSVSISKKTILSKIRIWHRRLGHVSEKDLVELKK